MPEYLSPGVYIEEFEVGARPIEGVSTSTAGFLGETERGPTEPRLVTSWIQFQQVYGSYFSIDGITPYLPYAVEGFFTNRGQRCYIGRITRRDATTASANLIGPGGAALTVHAAGEGKWGERIGILVMKGSRSKDDPRTFFRLQVYYWNKIPEAGWPPDPADITKFLRNHPPALSEDFDDLSVDKKSPDFYGTKVKSSLISLIKADYGSGKIPDDMATLTPLNDGEDGTQAITVDRFKRDLPEEDKPGMRRGLAAFREIDEIAILYAPDAYAIDGLPAALINHCETLKDRFAILDANDGISDVNAIRPRDDNPTMYAAYYYPWIKVTDPVNNEIKIIPPGGHIVGIYARTDDERGVYNAPANEVVKGAVGIEFTITKGVQNILNPRGVNCLRVFPGRGILVWGARTLSINRLWQYIAIRRLFNYIEESIKRGTQWVVFEPNDEKLWARVRATITQFLTRVWKDGALMGTKPEEAFFVKCDRTTMTQDDIDNGRLICTIGIAPVKPAEFVIFRIVQWTGGSSVTE